MPTIFVTAASGHIGSKLIPLLVETEDNKLVLPTSNSARLTSSLPKSESIIVVEGSIQDPQWVETQLRTHNVDTVFLCLTGTDELFTTMNIFSALQRTPSMKHIVYLSACGDFTLSSQGLRGWKAAHAIVKCPIEMVLRDLSSEMGFTYTILGPTLFFDNDLRQKGAILNGGVYPEPLGTKGASRVSTDDIADAVRIAALDQGRKWNGKKIALGSRKRYTVSVETILFLQGLNINRKMTFRRSGRMPWENQSSLLRLTTPVLTILKDISGLLLILPGPEICDW